MNEAEVISCDFLSVTSSLTCSVVSIFLLVEGSLWSELSDLAMVGVECKHSSSEFSCI